MCDKRESGLNLLYPQQISNIDIQNVAQMFIRMYAQKCLRNLHYSKINCCWKQKNKRVQNIKYVKIKVITNMLLGIICALFSGLDLYPFRIVAAPLIYL